MAGFSVFEFGTDGWREITTFSPTDLAYLERMRIGCPIYRRQK